MGSDNTFYPEEKKNTLFIIPFEICPVDLSKTHLRGFIIARCLSIAIAVSVKTDTFTVSACIKGQKPHINHGRFQRCNKAA